MAESMKKGLLTGITDEGRDLRGFTVKISPPFSFRPGQFVLLAIPDDMSVMKPYSIISADGDSIFLIIKKVGAFTARLFSLNEGDSILYSGPYGTFVLPEEDVPIVFVAGGIGVSPLYSMLLDIHAGSRKSNVYFFYSAGRVGEMALYDQIISIPDKRINVFYFFTREKTQHFSERISAETMREKVPEFQECRFYICGPDDMVRDLTGQLTRMGIPKGSIKKEIF